MGTTDKLVFYIVFHDWSDKDLRGIFITFTKSSEKFIVGRPSIFHHHVLVFSMRALLGGGNAFSGFLCGYLAGVEQYLRKRFLVSGIESWEEFANELKVSLENERLDKKLDRDWVFPETLKVEFSHRINEIL